MYRDHLQTAEEMLRAAAKQLAKAKQKRNADQDIEQRLKAQIAELEAENEALKAKISWLIKMLETNTTDSDPARWQENENENLPNAARSPGGA